MIFKNFIKVPKTKKFTYEPRHFDPVKEDIDTRVKIIESQVKAEKEGTTTHDDDYTYRISRAFRTQRTKPKSIFDFSSNLAFIRLIIVFILVMVLYAWLEYGDQIFEVFANSRNVWILAILLVAYFAYKIGVSRRS
ncbi:MAG: hypothetical protein NW226_21485 [Microscillaceae bacterium]|nr:hypothetical protein [Microscillaceae bacterium]